MNTNKNKRFTFFTPTFERTGSEIVLANLLATLPDSFNTTLVTNYKGGSLWEKIPSFISKSYLYSSKSYLSFFNKIIRALEKYVLVPYKLSKYKNSIWYINTSVLPELVSYAYRWNIPLILHTHELEQMLALLTEEQKKRLISYPSLIVANSQTSAAILQKMGRATALKICYPAINTSEIKRDVNAYQIKRKELQLSPNNSLWVMCGTLDENKNPTLFLKVAHLVLQKKPESRFMWIGGTDNLVLSEKLKRDAEQLGISHAVYWTGNVGSHYYSYFNCADGFMLTSLKESFSLVTLEALLIGLPVVANNCEGVVEILKKDLGKIVNNAEEMASAILDTDFNASENKKHLYRQRAAEFDIKIWGPQWNQMLNQFIDTQK